MSASVKTIAANRVPWLIQVILSIAGIIDSGYLTWIKLSHNEASCIKGVGDCYSVNTSPYSEVMGVPVAVFGMIGYVAIFLMLMLENRGENWKEYTPIIIFGIALFGVLYSAYLTYLEIAVIKAICPFCVLSAIMMLSLFVVAVIRLANNPSQS